MKIGEFSKLNHTTIDTVRHYIALNLITPQKKGSQFEFDHRCEQDFQDILRLKALGFSLQDIQTIIIFKRVGRLSGYEKSLYYQSLFMNKASSIEREIVSLSSSLEQLKKEIASFEKLDQQQFAFGVPLESLGLLCCHQCQRKLEMSSGQIEDGKVISGQLQCSCGTVYQINDGLLITDTAVASPDSSDILEDAYLERYIQNTDYEYLLNIHKSYDWIYSQPEINLSAAENILELGIGHGFFMRLLSDSISSDAVYVGIDRDLNRLKWLRNRFAINPPPFKLLLIAADFRALPLRSEAFDLLLDLSGSSNYGFENPDFLLRHATRYLKANSSLLASFLLFKNFSRASKIPSHLRHQFTDKSILENLQALDYTIRLSYETKPVKQGGIYEDYFVSGESVYTKMYYCQAK